MPQALDEQREASKAYARGRGWTVTDDDGTSGQDGETPRLAELVADLAAGEVDAVMLQLSEPEGVIVTLTADNPKA